MRIPNKIYRYEESVFPLMATILRTVSDQEVSLEVACEQVCGTRWSISDFIEALDALFALGSVEFGTAEGTIKRC